MIRLVTTADTEILAAAAAVERLPAGFPEVRCGNPASAEDPAALVGDVLSGARVVLCRILGGRRGWSDGFDLLRPALDEYAQRRGQELLEAHQRVRKASRIRNVKYRVEAQLPPDVLGIYVYLPKI